jgi:hypothetical protein
MRIFAKIFLAVWLVSQVGLALAQQTEPGTAANAPMDVTPHLQTDAERYEQRWILVGLMAGLVGVAGVYVGRKAKHQV